MPRRAFIPTDFRNRYAAKQANPIFVVISVMQKVSDQPTNRRDAARLPQCEQVQIMFKGIGMSGFDCAWLAPSIEPGQVQGLSCRTLEARRCIQEWRTVDPAVAEQEGQSPCSVAVGPLRESPNRNRRPSKGEMELSVDQHAFKCPRPLPPAGQTGDCK